MPLQLRQLELHRLMARHSICLKRGHQRRAAGCAELTSKLRERSSGMRWQIQLSSLLSRKEPCTASESGEDALEELQSFLQQLVPESKQGARSWNSSAARFIMIHDRQTRHASSEAWVKKLSYSSPLHHVFNRPKSQSAFCHPRIQISGEKMFKALAASKASENSGRNESHMRTAC